MATTTGRPVGPDADRPTGGAAAGALSGLGVLAGLGAFVTASCCAIPIAVSTLGVSAAALAGIERLLVYRLWFLAAAALVIAVGWASVWLAERRRRQARACGSCAGRPRRWPVLAALTVASLVTALAAAWPLLQTDVIRWLLSIRGLA